MAQDATTATTTNDGGGGVGLFNPGNPIWLFFLLFLIMYFLIIRPQQKKQKEHREMVQNLKKGDRVVTGGGIHGRVTGMDDTTVTVEIADKVRVKLNRGNVAAVVQQGAKEQASRK
jgi:preprotein translocase subunit YajC